MSTVTLGLLDDEHARLWDLAMRRGTMAHRLLVEVASLLINEFDAEKRFRMLAAQSTGQVERGQASSDKAWGDKG